MKLTSFILFCIVNTIAGETEEIDEISSRIVGGKNATSDQAPCQCSVQRYSQHTCGCAIISENWILTAAHCVGGSTSNIEILVGTNDLQSGGTRFTPERFIIHESYDRPRRMQNDIALIKMAKMQFNSNVKPIKYSTNFVKDGAQLQATGWGRLSANGNIPRFLQVVNLKAISNQRCRRFYRNTVFDGILCTYTKVGEGVCNGDSGGPIVMGDELVGLTSFAVLCAKGYPDGFTRISHYFNWIQINIEKAT
ncbi:chymotrypsin-2-like [Contarinia nasturtii]|uniref:chymotrypsin-2-like n=1 Tax=Contarinia nasturtii TaxID=265458 RepID=UPI0012D3D943|nr:chymotrypsin-2-like [Contarinia nasturtii]